MRGASNPMKVCLSGFADKGFHNPDVVPISTGVSKNVF